MKKTNKELFEKSGVETPDALVNQQKQLFQRIRLCLVFLNLILKS